MTLEVEVSHGMGQAASLNMIAVNLHEKQHKYSLCSHVIRWKNAIILAMATMVY